MLFRALHAFLGLWNLLLLQCIVVYAWQSLPLIRAPWKGRR